MFCSSKYWNIKSDAFHNVFFLPNRAYHMIKRAPVKATISILCNNSLKTHYETTDQYCYLQRCYCTKNFSVTDINHKFLAQVTRHMLFVLFFCDEVSHTQMANGLTIQLYQCKICQWSYKICMDFPFVLLKHHQILLPCLQLHLFLRLS